MAAPLDGHGQAIADEIARRGMTHGDVVNALRASGLSRDELRQRLAQRGYDPSLADRYFDLVNQGDQPPDGEAPDALTQALSQVGVGLRAEGDIDRLLPGEPVPVREPPVPTVHGLPIFGMELFSRATTQFQPVTSGPVDPEYRLGPGDQIYLILTGDVETAHALEVTREGFVFIPDVGQVLVNGLTMRELEQRLYDRLGQVYSGVTRGAAATTQFQATLGQLRSNQVFVIGDVYRPGAYQVSSVGTVLNALYAAGGPSANGSFRSIQVRRAGQVIRLVDLYNYILRGDSGDDIRLEQGDIVFVPVVGVQVGITGAVRRSAMFEMRDGEELRDLLGFAGRLEADALLSRVQIDRIVPPIGRTPGIDRVLEDVDILQLVTDQGARVPLRDGDLVQVFGISGERRNRLVLVGEVRRPGVYEWYPGMTMMDVIERAEGLDDRAYTARAHIYRFNPTDGTRTLFRTPLVADGAGFPAENVVLADRDSVVIYSQAELRNEEVVTVSGFVRNPGTYPLARGTTVPDLIIAAGGLTRGANAYEAEVARVPDRSVRTDTTAHVIPISLPPGPESLFPVGGGGAGSAGDVPQWLPGADELVLQDGDRVYVRNAPGHSPLQTVSITGQVLFPGIYALTTRGDRLVDVIERTGGVTSEAYLPGLRLFRGGYLVSVDATRAVANSGGRNNIVLEQGDSIYIPEYDPTVLVMGAVGFQTRVLYEPGRGLDYYIDRAGGYTPVADRNRVAVTRADGERDTVNRFFLFRRKPQPTAGSTVYVPPRPEERSGIDLDQLLSRTLSIVSVAATVIIAIDRL